MASGQNLRSDAQAGVRAVATSVARQADRESMASRALWARIERETGLSRSTVAKWLAWLHEQQLLVTFEHGSTWRWRPTGLVAAAQGPRAAVYLLTLPTESETANEADVETTRTPLVSHLQEVVIPSHARGSQPLRGREDRFRTRAGKPKPTPGSRRWSRHQAAAEIQKRSLALRRLSTAHVASIFRELLDSGWTPGDVLHALDFTPDGQAYIHTADVRSPAGWARKRIAAWLQPDGTPLPSKSAAAAERAAALRAEQTARQSAYAQQASNAVTAVAALGRDGYQALRQQISHNRRSAQWLPGTA